MKTALRRAASAVALALALGACASTGTQTIDDFGRYQDTQRGETTKIQLHSTFGQPHTVRAGETTDESVWTYYQMRRRMSGSSFIPYAGILVGGSNYHVTEARFTFDGAGVLTQSRREQYSRFRNSWVEIADELTPDEGTGVAEEMQRLGLPFDPEEDSRVAGWLDHIGE